MLKSKTAQSSGIGILISNSTSKVEASQHASVHQKNHMATYKVCKDQLREKPHISFITRKVSIISSYLVTI